MSTGLRWTEEQWREHQAKQRPLEPTRHTLAPKPAPVCKPAAAPGTPDMLGAVRFSLPWPPTLNLQYHHIDGKQVLKTETRMWRRLAAAKIAAQVPGVSLGKARVQVQLVLHPPHANAFDLDNRCKATLDAIQHGGLIDNDNQIDVLVVTRGERVPGGRCDVTLIEIHPEA